MTSPNKYICIHGHFYQPPRENAWLEVVEKQDSAAPFHDWNTRINFECYAPNAAARILDESGYITHIVNNYARISFNFGPTLLSWLAKRDPATYRAIQEADKESIDLFGQGSALAQAYSHLILPLANTRDQRTQVIWGIRDFEFRFGRKPRGMWLAEAAVDTPSLEILAKQGIEFTILAPRQAKSVKQIGQTDWSDVSNGSIDPRRPYLCKLPSGKSISIFFYDGNVSQAVAFEGLLNNGKAFAQRIAGTLNSSEEPLLAHIATDGESYGHHHKKGEMALADCLDYVEKSDLATLTNYASFLDAHPPSWEVEIHENSSWSCVHGVERWRSNCGCNSGGKPGWNQAWRAPLRETLDWLRDELIPVFEEEGAKLLQDPWAARDAYISIILDRSDASIEQFMLEQTNAKVEAPQKIQILRLLEMQRNALLMYTSCGWFFDEISGIETDQILQYANRAIHYAQQVAGLDLHQEFIDRLEKAPSNVHENGAVSYKDKVIPARVNLERVAMHFAVSALFEEHPEDLELFNYRAEIEDFSRLDAGAHRLVMGRIIVRSTITRSERHYSFAALHMGQQNIIGNLAKDMPAESFQELEVLVSEAFQTPDLGKVIGYMQEYFGSEKYSIWHLFRDEKRKILQEITDENLKLVEADFRSIYRDNYQLMTSMLNSNIPLPDAYINAIGFVLNRDLHQFFERKKLSLRSFKQIVDEFAKWGTVITDAETLRLAASERLHQEIEGLSSSEPSIETVQILVAILEGLAGLNVELDLWKSQNAFYDFLTHRPSMLFQEDQEDLKKLGELLQVRLSLTVLPTLS